MRRERLLWGGVVRRWWPGGGLLSVAAAARVLSCVRRELVVCRGGVLQGEKKPARKIWLLQFGEGGCCSNFNRKLQINSVFLVVHVLQNVDWFINYEVAGASPAIGNNSCTMHRAERFDASNIRPAAERPSEERTVCALGVRAS